MTPARASSSGLGSTALAEGLTPEAANLERFLVAAFPHPGPRDRLLLADAVVRIAGAIPWLEAAAPGLGGRATEVAAALAGAHVRFDRMDRAPSLSGKYLRARSIIGKEPAPKAGVEALRACLFICALRWHEEGDGRTTAVEALAASVRELSEMAGSRQQDSPLLPLLPALGEAGSLAQFIGVADALADCGNERLARAWTAHFRPTLTGLARPQSPSTPPTEKKPERSARPAGRARLERRAYDEPVGTGRRVRVQASPAIPGEAPDEDATSAFVEVIPDAASNPDARKLASYNARQSIWGGNHLLLTNHPDALPFRQFQQVVNGVLEELALDVAGPHRRGLIGLLLQALTGRTPETLPAIKLDADDEIRPGECRLSVANGYIELCAFWLREEVGPNGYFQPSPEHADKFEPVARSFKLPLPPQIIGVLRTHEAEIKALGDRALEESLRRACKGVAARVGFPLVLGQVRRSFSAHFYEKSRDLALTQLVCADTVSQSDASTHYYSPRKRDVAAKYWAFLEHLLQFHGQMPSRFNEAGRVGAAGLLVGPLAKRIASTSGGLLNCGVSSLLGEGRWPDVHHAMVGHLGGMAMVVLGHRPGDALLDLTKTSFHWDQRGGMALFRDKVHGNAHDPRIAALPRCVSEQIQAYLDHLQGMAALQPSLSEHVESVLAGDSPLLFGIGDKGEPTRLSFAKFSTWLPECWKDITDNWGRTWIRTRGVELGLPPELAAIQLGHLEAVGYPFSNGSPTSPVDAISATAPHLEKMARAMGWRVRSGIPLAKQGRAAIPCPPLQSWKEIIASHEAITREQDRQWRQWRRAGIAASREQARKDVLEHPVLLERGIPQAYIDDTRLAEAKPLAREEAEAIRDLMFEDAGDDIALGIARTRALRQVLRRINRLLKITGQDPRMLGVFRRPLDNAFVPYLPVALDQVEALRAHAKTLAVSGPGDRKDFARACARVAYTLAMFGFMERPDEILGVIQHRERLDRPVRLPGTILVPWDDRPDRIAALRGLAAVSLANLAKRFKGATMPGRREIAAALSDFLPKWALDGTDAHGHDALDLICQTVGVANRYELSPAVRLALDPDTGSTNACMADQLAMIDGDPPGTIKREEKPGLERRGGAFTSSFPIGKGSARSQYLALCAIVPASGRSLELPLTGKSIPASQLVREGTRRLVIDEVKAMLAQHGDRSTLWPITRLLALWVRKMLTVGTPGSKDPSDATIRTYLTRIGGTLVECLGHRSMADLDEVELEEIYLAAIEAGGANRGQAASSVLEFHRCAQAHYEMPEIDTSTIRAHLGCSIRNADAALILPQERLQIIERAWEKAEAGGSDSLESSRIQRQAAAALVGPAWGGMRRSEVLGLKGADVWPTEKGVGVRLRRNRSRRLKTSAARRTIYLDGAKHPGVAEAIQWVDIDGRRTEPWRRGRSYVFSPLDSSSSAEGREHIARECIDCIRDVTQRRDERLHRFRHLVAFETTIPLFLSQQDRTWFDEIFPDQGIESHNDLTLPRELMERVVLLGHVDWRTTLRSYHHLGWLLRSRADADMDRRFMSRQWVAFAMGVTLQAVDKVVQENVGIHAADAWISHVATIRVVPSLLPHQSTDSEGKPKIWTSQDLDGLFATANCVGGLSEAVAITGGKLGDAKAIERHANVASKRIGRRLYRAANTIQTRASSSVGRRTDQEVVTAILQWYDGLDSVRRQRADVMIRSLMDLADPRAGTHIEASGSDIEELATLLGCVPGMTLRIDTISRCDGISVVDILCDRSGERGEPRPVNLAVRRAIATAWIAARLAVPHS